MKTSVLPMDPAFEAPTAPLSRRRRRLPRVFWALNLLLLLLGAPVALHVLLTPVAFNQFWIQKLRMHYGAMTAEGFLDALRSAHASGVDILRRWPARGAPGLEDPKALFRHVYAWVPPYAVVYPTEGFYYFRTTLGDGRKVTGNIRVADLDKGTLSFACFEESSPDKAVILNVGPAEGLEVLRCGPDLREIRFDGKTVSFKLPDTARQAPRKLRMLPEEEFVGQIEDESGIRLFLLFNRATTSFYEVLNEEDGVLDTLKPLEHGHWKGERTGFVFYEDQDYARKLLVGIHLGNGFANNYYDGPGDQVPFRAPLRDKLHAAYPSTLTDEGVDEHGVWQGKDQWCRFVVAPFHSYAKLEELAARYADCDPAAPKGEFWTALTKEWWYTQDWLDLIETRLKEEGKAMPQGVSRRTRPVSVSIPNP